jgi:HK97 family phage prohead protease
MPEVLTRAEAAQARAAGVRTLADRPSQRRVSERAGRSAFWTPDIRAQVNIRANDDGGESHRFGGFASVTGRAYEMWDMFGAYDELVAVGAFEETLAQDDLDVPLVLGHDPMRTIANLGNPNSPLQLSEVTDGPTTGLDTLAPTLRMEDPDTAYIVPKLRLQLVQEMSFRFSITEGRWSEDFTQFTIRKVDIHRGDVSIVKYGANPMTVGAGLRQQKKDRAPAGPDPRALLLALARAND